MNLKSKDRNSSVLDLRRAPDHETMSRWAAEAVLNELRGKPSLILAAATGSTPTRAYELLAQQLRQRPEDIDRLSLVKVDEWLGLAMNDPATCEFYLQRHLVRPLGLPANRYVSWNSNPADPQAECDRIRNWLTANGPIDVCVLGLGANGHLAFNEPAEDLIPDPHVAELSATSMQHVMLRQAHGTPRGGLTIGMADILRSRRILLLVSGAAKQQQLRRLMEPRISTDFPASFLWLHPNATILCDADAAEMTAG